MVSVYTSLKISSFTRLCQWKQTFGNTVHDIWLSEVLPLTLVWLQLNRVHNCDTWISAWINQHQFWHISWFDFQKGKQYKNHFINQLTTSVSLNLSFLRWITNVGLFFFTGWQDVNVVNEDWLYFQCKMLTSILYEVGRALVCQLWGVFLPRLSMPPNLQRNSEDNYYSEFDHDQPKQVSVSWLCY